MSLTACADPYRAVTVTLASHPLDWQVSFVLLSCGHVVLMGERVLYPGDWPAGFVRRSAAAAER